MPDFSGMSFGEATAARKAYVKQYPALFEINKRARERLEKRCPSLLPRFDSCDIYPDPNINDVYKRNRATDATTKGNSTGHSISMRMLGQGLFGKGNVAVIKNLVFLYLFFWVNYASSQPVAASYANLFETGRAIVVVTPKSVTISDLEHPAERCEKNDKFVCVSSKYFVFSYPKAADSNKEWSHLGAKYKVLSHRELILRGELINYLVIRQTMTKSAVDFLYSEKLGVIGLKAVRGLELSLLEECGFGAIAARRPPYVNCMTQ